MLIVLYSWHRVAYGLDWYIYMLILSDIWSISRVLDIVVNLPIVPSSNAFSISAVIKSVPVALLFLVYCSH